MMNPWSCSKFADFLRGEPKPGALGFDEWEEWKDRVRSERPWGYFLAERALPALQKTIQSPARIVRSARYYLRNRFVTKTHFLKTGLEPGVYHELDERIIHGLFNELRDFVEVELACMTAYGDKNYRFRKGRCPEAGLAHLEWASGLKYDELVGKDDPRYGEPTPNQPSRSRSCTSGGPRSVHDAPNPRRPAAGPSTGRRSPTTRKEGPPPRDSRR
jgi:hypothetical protein